jgi:hypothetical protein
MFPLYCPLQYEYLCPLQEEGTVLQTMKLICTDIFFKLTFEKSIVNVDSKIKILA